VTCILVSGSESWTLVRTGHIRFVEDLHDCLVLFLSRKWNSLDSQLWWSGDVDAVQQILQSVSGDCGFISESLDHVGIAIHFFLFGVTQMSVVFIIFAFSLIAFFFLLIIIVIILRWLLSFLSVFSCWYHDHDLEGVLLLRNMLRRVGLWLWLR
jgi:hypothetical protein